MRAVIFAGAEIKDYSFCHKYLEEDSFIVCCDSGMRHARELGVTPDIIVGDFDSVDKDTFDFFKEKNIQTIRFAPEKDETDMELGLDAVLESGADDITIIGGIGSRMDHTLANCHYLLYLLKKGVKARIVNENNEIFLIDKGCVIKGKKGDLVSTLPLSLEVTGVTTKGLQYPLKDATLSVDGRLIAVSNVMLSDEAEVTVKDGYLYIMKCND